MSGPGPVLPPGHKAHLQQVYVLWGALLATTLLVVGVVPMLPAQPPVPELTTITLVLALAAVPQLVVSVVVPRRFALAPEPARFQTEQRAADDDVAAFRGLRHELVFSAPEAVLSYAISRLQLQTIMRCALREALALEGLVLVQLGLPLHWAAAWFIVGIAGVALAFPRLEPVLEQLERQHGARLRLPAAAQP